VKTEQESPTPSGPISTSEAVTSKTISTPAAAQGQQEGLVTTPAVTTAAASMPFIETVPINSYTSSDEEDDGDEFFDAEEEIAVDEIETSLKMEAEEEASMQSARNSRGSGNMIDMNAVMKNEGKQQQKQPRRSV